MAKTDCIVDFEQRFHKLTKQTNFSLAYVSEIIDYLHKEKNYSRQRKNYDLRSVRSSFNYLLFYFSQMIMHNSITDEVKECVKLLNDLYEFNPQIGSAKEISSFRKLISA